MAAPLHERYASSFLFFLFFDSQTFQTPQNNPVNSTAHHAEQCQCHSLRNGKGSSLLIDLQRRKVDLATTAQNNFLCRTQDKGFRDWSYWPDLNNFCQRSRVQLRWTTSNTDWCLSISDGHRHLCSWLWRLPSLHNMEKPADWPESLQGGSCWM